MQAVLMMPLLIGGRPWGLVEVYDSRARRFGDGDTTLAELFAGQAAALVGRLEDGEAVERIYRETLASLANALEAKDGGTSRHAHEVVTLSVETAARLGLRGPDLRAVELGALLHDIG